MRIARPGQQWLSYQPPAVTYDSRLSHLSLAQYTRAYNKLYYWAFSNHIPWDTTQTNVDHMLADYMTHLRQQYQLKGKSGRSLGEQTLNGFLHFNTDTESSKLRRTRGALQAWLHDIPTKPHSAMPWPVVVALAMHMLQSSRMQYAVALLLQFDCYLRVSELCSIRVNHMLLPGDQRYDQSLHKQQYELFRAGPKLIVTLPASKTGPFQHVDMEDVNIERVVTHWITYRKRHGYTNLFDFNDQMYNSVLKQHCEALALTQFNYTSHSLRHGGASYHITTKGISALTGIQYRGRWKKSTSVVSYTHDAARAAQLDALPYGVVSMYERYRSTYDIKLINAIQSLTQ